MIIETGRFGQITIGSDEIIQIPNSILGLPDEKEFCLVDPGDDTLILWLQSTKNPSVAFAVLEPKIFKPDYRVRLSAAELRELKLESLSEAAVLSILTIPSDITLMSANLKAPIVVNLKAQIARQVVLQENEYSLKHPMFKELRAHLLTIQSQRKSTPPETDLSVAGGPVRVKSLPASGSVVGL